MNVYTVTLGNAKTILKANGDVSDIKFLYHTIYNEISFGNVEKVMYESKLIPEGFYITGIELKNGA